MANSAIRQTILLVDDRSENLIALEAILEAPDRKLLKAMSGNEALNIALKGDVSLILLDVRMPDMDGFEVLDLLKNNTKTKQIPVIFCSAISKEKHYMARGFDAGAADYLFKPIDADLLTAKVRVFLELDMQRRKLQQTLLQLHRVQQENERLLKAMGEGVLGIDKVGVVTFANPSAATLLGREIPAIIGVSVDDLFFLNAEGASLWKWRASPALEAVSSGMPFQSSETHCLYDGKLRQLDFTVTPINDRANGFSGAVIILRNADSRRRIQTGLQQRRIHPRRELSSGLTVFDRATGATLGQLANISEGGLRLAGKKKFLDGQRMSCSMILPQMVNGKTTVSFNAIVVWVKPVNGGDVVAGFRFSDVTPESLDIISYLMENL